MKLELLKENFKGKTYDCGGFKLLYRHRGSISGDNKVNPEENIYLIHGKAIVTIENESTEYNAPAIFKIPAKTFHKIEAISDITMILLEG